MSTNSKPVDENRLKSAFEEIRSDQGEIYRKSWLVVGHVDQNPHLVDVVASNSLSESPFEELCEVLKGDQVMYVLLRLTSSFDMSTTVKFVYVHWVGEKVAYAKKGRFGVVGGSVKDMFTPFHLLIETSSVDDLTEENITKQLEEGSGVRNKVIEGGSEGRQMRGFTAHHQTTQATSALRNIAPAAYAVQVSEELQASIKQVRNDQSDITWVLAGFQNGDFKKPLQLMGSGSGGVEGLKGCLEEGLVQFGLWRTSDVYDSINTVKFVYISWIGEDVKPMTKGKLTAYSGPIEKVFSPAHISMTFNHLCDLQEGVIKDKVQASSGSKIHVK